MTLLIFDEDGRTKNVVYHCVSIRYDSFRTILYVNYIDKNTGVILSKNFKNIFFRIDV